MRNNKLNQKKVIDKIELDLLSTLFNYVVPFTSKKIDKKEQDKNLGRLENIINEPKININNIKELESLILGNLDKSVKVNKNVKINSNNIFYNLNFIKKRESKVSNNCLILINYEENKKEENFAISIKKSGEEIYFAEINNKKDAANNTVPYKVKITYEDNYAEERLSITYKQQLKNYMQHHIESKEDTTNKVPLKWLNILPETIMGGVLGFTYLGDNSMGRRADLTGKTARMVDIHESIHTPDEYETRILTDWIMEKVKSKYVK